MVTLVEAARRADIETIPDPATTQSAAPDVVDFGDRELDVEQQAEMLDGAADHFGAVYGGADEICVFESAIIRD
jgi:hypothetical protein